MSATASIILCSHNRADHLEKTLQSLRQVAIPEDWSVELLLVDNASMDATPEVMQAFNHPRMDVRRIREEKTGLSNARNRGLQEARGEVLLFTDDDVRVPSGWIEGMVTPILRDEADAVAGGVELVEEIQEGWMTPRYGPSLRLRSELMMANRTDLWGQIWRSQGGSLTKFLNLIPNLGLGGNMVLEKKRSSRGRCRKLGFGSKPPSRSWCSTSPIFPGSRGRSGKRPPRTRAALERIGATTGSIATTLSPPCLRVGCITPFGCGGKKQ
jgi:glycosyltransferase involved in cell wall biosynthesis